MGVKGMWQVNATALVLLIVVNLTLSMTGEIIWLVISLLALAGSMYMCFRQGMGLGHGACGISSTVERARQEGDKVYSQLDAKYLAQTWSRETGIKGLLASALVPYAVGGIYIILTLLRLDTPALIARVAAWLLSLPYWPVVMHWHESFVELTPALVAMLMVSPFILPACTFAGYMQGPKLWARTETAMKEGRRRAKAKARVGKKLAPKARKPEI